MQDEIWKVAHNIWNESEERKRKDVSARKFLSKIIGWVLE